MQSVLWLGTQSSYEAVVEARAKMMADFGSSGPELPELLNVQGSVGIINIQGSLVDGNAGFMRYFGVTGYGDIRDALVAAVQHQGVQSVLLNIKSGGGEVAGCHELAQLIQRVSAVKPVVTYAGGMMASAALWLGTSAQRVYASETALVGSIGILSIHAERSKQLEMDGVKVTVVRAGTEKALANPYEPLSERGKQGLEEKAMALYDIFLGYVADTRGASITSADTKYGQGKEFVGKQAVTAGLIDEVGTFEDAYVKAQALGEAKPKRTQTRAVPSTRAQSDTTLSANVEQVSTLDVPAASAAVDNAPIAEGTNMKLPLTQEQLVAMAAAGVTLDVADTTNADASATADAAASTDAAASADATEPVDPVVALTAQVTDLTAQVAALTAATAELESVKANSDAMLTIVRASVSSMAVALNDSIKAEGLDATQVVAEHARLSTLFKNKFKSGAVAMPAAKAETVQAPAMSPVFAEIARSLPGAK